MERINLKSNLLAKDLNHILTHTKEFWEEIRDKRIFITGGTGFIGSWLLESFAWINENLNLNASVVVLTRDSQKFSNKFPHLASYPAIKFHIGDVKNFDFPQGEFSHIIHAAATSAYATFFNEDPLVKFDTLFYGTRRICEFAVKCNAKKILFTSSGAVYGEQPISLSHISEEFSGAPLPFNLEAHWGEGKRVAEFLLAYYSKKFSIEIKIARCFTFVGPYIPLDIHYAIGNFIRDSINGGPIVIKNNPNTLRSYLYVADLIIWLWVILFKGKTCWPYNVGSEDAITIKDLAYKVASYFPYKLDVEILNSFDKPKRYIPSTKRAREELGLMQLIPLDEAIKKTIEHVKANKILYNLTD
jgi:dTDP-glucose 4,6-dehydratase